MLEFISDFLYRLFIVDCVGCGSLVVHRKGLCLSCEYHILDRYLAHSEKVHDLNNSQLTFRYLFRWIPNASDILSAYVHLLKSPLAKPCWDEIAKLFIAHHEISQTNVIFVPIPSSRERKHSLYFATALAQKLDGTVIQALSVAQKNNANIEQKRKSKTERQRVSFEINEEFTDVLRGTAKIVLVDDVITTGASYQAAYNALNVLSENIELWAGFRRESTLVLEG
jgi:predicted amidophosphoribosyltransferase